MKQRRLAIRLRSVAVLILLAAPLLMTGCVSGLSGRKSERRSTMVDFLYPDRKAVTKKPGVPALTIPVDVGIAFVPRQKKSYRSVAFSEEEQLHLLEAVADRFRKLPFIRKIETIPEAYLKPGGGFENLDQVRAMYGVDVIALVSYDQVQHTDVRAYSFAYLTVVGMYLVNGEENDTSTMLETSVFHVPSRSLLFRAPGTSRIKAGTTRIEAAANRREHAAQGMKSANKKMIENLSKELERFQKRIKERPEEIKITRAPGYRGGGDLGVLLPVSMTLLIGLGQIVRRRRDQ